jgi:hypothetical protein
MRKARKRKKPAKTGPKPEILKIDGNWKEAVKKSLAKKRPATGWPK